MDPAVKRGFAIGFVVVAAAAAAYAWREGWLPGADGGRTANTEAPVVDLVPSVPKKPEAGKPADAAPDAGRSAPSSPPSSAPTSPSAGAAAPGAETPKPASPGSGVAALSPNPPGAPKPAAPSPEKGAFDIVRVEPSGELVVAGRCPAGCTAELTANGKPQDKATADGSGNFAMVPPKLPPGDHQLGLKVTTPDGKSAISEQSVTVSVPSPPSKEVVVVLNEPNAPSKILQQPGQAPAAAPPTGPETQMARREPEEARTPARTVAGLSLGAVDAEKGRFFVQGTAPNGARLRVYLNNALIAEPVAGADQRWSVKVERGLAPGRYVVRVDHVEGASGKVTSRAEARFDYEAEAETAAAESAAPSRRPEPRAATPASPEPKSATAPASPAPSGATPPAPGPSGLSSPQSAAPPPPASAEPSRAGAPPSPGSPAGDGAATRSGDAGAPPHTAPESSPPATTAEQAPSAAPADQAPSAPDAANPVVASIDTAQVKRGDSLWRISRATYGQGRRYTVIFTANDDQIRNPNLIYPGQVLVLPADKADAAPGAGR